MNQTSLDEWTDGNDSTSDHPERRCLSFTVSGPWGHFRRIEGNVVKQTYWIIPRTTVAGLLAAMLGIGRNEYYDLFGPDVSLIAIQPVAELRTINLPMSTLSTAAEHFVTVPRRGPLRVKLPDPSKPRQRHNYEVLVDPAYRIDVWLADDECHRDLRTTLETRTSYYVPSLGLSEHLAEITYHGEFLIEIGPADGEIEIDSAIPDAVDSVVPVPGVRCQIEQSPAFMTADGGGRTTTAFTSYAYAPSAEPLRVCNVPTRIVDGRTVVFA